MNKPILTLTGIEKSYQRTNGNVPVLRDVNLTLRPGETVALVAPSGAGKSTLLHIAGLLDTPDSGDVSIGGQVATGLSDAKRTRIRRQDIGFVYQFHHLLPEFNAAENIILPQRADGVSRVIAQSRAMSLLATVGLTDRALHRPAELSGGEQQRVAFCRALANGPRLILADEPTGNLDPDTADTVFDALLALARDTGLAALVATHNLNLAARMDRQVRLTAGTITTSDELA
jgi:lipoprotein-releasing system ATP-binding protein